MSVHQTIFQLESAFVHEQCSGGAGSTTPTTSRPSGSTRAFCCPWIVYLGFTLPANYVAQNWPATWIGFDCLLVAFMAATAVLAWLRRQLVMLTAFTTGVLLICDAWFDILTAGLGRNLAVPILTLPPLATRRSRRL
jgi:hypothetical protein